MNTANSFANDKVIALGGFPILRTTSAGLILLMKAKMQQQQITLFFANTNFIVQCQPYQSAMSNDDTIIVNDGVGIDIATWLIHRKTFIENLNGTDFSPLFLQSLGTTARVFLIGAKPGIALRAAHQLSSEYGINIVGVRNGYDEAKDTETLIQDINTANATIVLVAMGNPYQEQWIIDNRQRINARVLMGVGALFDFLAGDKARAPALVQRLRMEWFYRLCLEPSRLLRRYTLDIAVFLRLCLQQGKTLKVPTDHS